MDKALHAVNADAYQKILKEIGKLPTSLQETGSWIVFMIPVIQLVLTNQLGVFFAVENTKKSPPIQLPHALAHSNLMIMCARHYCESDGCITARDFLTDFFSVVSASDMIVAVLVE